MTVPLRGWWRRRARERAAGTLARQLRDRDPLTAPHDPDLLAVCLAYLRLYSSRDPQLPLRAWAQYAYDTARHLHGADHPDTLAAGQELAAELDFDRDHSAAAVVRQALIDSYTRLGDPLEAVQVWFDLGCTLHALGRCDDGVTAAQLAWQDWEQTVGRVDPIGLRHLVVVAAMLRACHRAGDAAPLIALARYRIHAGIATFNQRDRVAVIVGLLAQQPLALDDHAGVCTRHTRNPTEPAGAAVPDGDGSAAGTPQDAAGGDEPFTVFDLL